MSYKSISMALFFFYVKKKVGSVAWWNNIPCGICSRFSLTLNVTSKCWGDFTASLVPLFSGHRSSFIWTMKQKISSSLELDVCQWTVSAPWWKDVTNKLLIGWFLKSLHPSTWRWPDGVEFNGVCCCFFCAGSLHLTGGCDGRDGAGNQYEWNRGPGGSAEPHGEVGGESSHPDADPRRSLRPLVAPRVNGMFISVSV